MAENEYVLKQRNVSGCNVQIKLVDGRELQVFSKSKKSKKSYSVDILSLQDESKKVILIAWKWLLYSIGFFLITLLLLKILPGILNVDKNLYLGIVLVIGMVGSLVSLTFFWKKTSRKHIFYSRNAHVPIVILSAGNPSKKLLSDFVTVIEKRIKKFRNHMDVSEEKQLTGEMKMLRRLSDSGVISKKDYEKAKTKLFSGFDSNLK
ncbi:MAG: hypothetical protein KAT06_04870 [Gammaproteobacteria bacterium]|nr:hypothetical protein [Gammaproteobacteria bacterium]